MCNITKGDVLICIKSINLYKVTKLKKYEVIDVLYAVNGTLIQLINDNNEINSLSISVFEKTIDYRNNLIKSLI